MAPGSGDAITAFNQAYLTSAEAARRGELTDLELANYAEALRRPRQEQEDLAGLVGAFQGRSRAVPPTTIAGPSLANVVTSGGQAISDAGELAQAGIASPGVAGIPAPTPTPATGLPVPRTPLLRSLAPEAGGRLLASQSGRAAVKDLEEAERQQEADDNRRLAEEAFSQATTAVKGNDPLGFYDNAAKALRLLGRHDQAGVLLEHGMRLRQDKEQMDKTQAYMTRVGSAVAAYQNDPSPEAYATMLGAMASADTPAARDLQLKYLEQTVKKTFDTDPRVVRFQRGLANVYAEAGQQGKAIEGEAAWREAIKRDPDGWQAYLFDAIRDQKRIPEVVLKKILRWDVLDPKEVPKDLWGTALFLTSKQNPTLEPGDPRWMERFWVNAKQLAENFKKMGGEEEARRKELSELRQEMGSIQAALRAQDISQDPERERLLKEREQWLLAEIDRVRAGGQPGKGPAPSEAKPELKARPPAGIDPVKQPDRYLKSMRAEFNRMKQAYPKASDDEIMQVLKRAGWQRPGG